MSFLDKILGKKKDPFADASFDTSLPPLSEAKTSPDVTPGTDFSQTGIPSTGVASFMEQTGDNLTGLPPIEDTASPLPTQNLGATPLSQTLPQSTGQQLAHNYMQQQTQTTQASSEQQNQPLQKSSAHSLEVIDLKLDAIRSELSAITQRLEKIEQKKW